MLYPFARVLISSIQTFRLFKKHHPHTNREHLVGTEDFIPTMGYDESDEETHELEFEIYYRKYFV